MGRLRIAADDGTDGITACIREFVGNSPGYFSFDLDVVGLVGHP